MGMNRFAEKLDELINECLFEATPEEVSDMISSLEYALEALRGEYAVPKEAAE